ncbi:MAG: glycerol-3-phosphate acyltransferase [Anaerolineales bacterium]|nr:glycerol-3-phosphate acyltransferase [Anaerolineales bacterium]
MQILLAIGLLLFSYLLGSIPFGLVIVRVKTGQDIRQVESGRTGGTNVMRAAGFWAGLATAILDIFKAAVAVWIARLLAPANAWLHVLAPVMAILGHNYSIFLRERDENGRLRLRGGAGGASTFGGAFGLWPLGALIILPICLLILFGIGYASLATLSAALLAILIFAYRAWIGASPWQYILYGVLTEMILIWALRPNIRRLFKGTERVIGWRARRRKTSKRNHLIETAPLDHSSSSSSSSSS